MINYIFDPAIKSHITNYMSLLSSARDVNIDSFIPSFIAYNPIIHRHVASEQLDLDALNFSLTRLPKEIFSVTKVILVQSYEDIKTIGFDVTQWRKVQAPGRRRLTFINPSGNTLACIISSESDIHDLINCLVSFIIERRKLGKLINGNYKKFISEKDISVLNLDSGSSKRLNQILGTDWHNNLINCALNNPMLVRMYGRTEPQYQQNATAWIKNLINHSLILGVEQTPIYFISSNSHSIVNIVSGFIKKKQNYIFDFASKSNSKLYDQWFEIKRKENECRLNDFLYYVYTGFLKQYPDFVQEKELHESGLGIVSVNSTDAFQSNTQLVPVRSIVQSAYPDTNLSVADKETLVKSNAYILNIEYPLGSAAYYLLNQIFQTFSNLQAAYIMGKAAILKGNIGDIQIPNFIYDETSQISYKFNNIFNQQFNFKTFISNVFTSQKESCVYGTYLENTHTVEQYLSNMINVIEMENGPFLRSLSQKYCLHPQTDSSLNPTIDLTSIPIEVGIINYASDNPLVQNLTQEATSLQGVEPVYVSSLAVLQRIVDLETQRLSSQTK